MALDSSTIDRALAAYLGFACGDALATVEFMTRPEIAALRRASRNNRRRLARLAAGTGHGRHRNVAGAGTIAGPAARL